MDSRRGPDLSSAPFERANSACPSDPLSPSLPPRPASGFASIPMRTMHGPEGACSYRFTLGALFNEGRGGTRWKRASQEGRGAHFRESEAKCEDGLQGSFPPSGGTPARNHPRKWASGRSACIAVRVIQGSLGVSLGRAGCSDRGYARLLHRAGAW